MKQKIILFGGTFDPIHQGHLLVADSAIQQIHAEKIIFIPARRSPHKNFLPVADGDMRLEMISIAIADKDKYTVSDCELKRPEPSFTLDTIRNIKSEYPKNSLFYWLLGADMVKDLPKWHKIHELIDECHLCVMLRPGFEQPSFSKFEPILGLQRVKKLEKNVILTPLVDVSSTKIRQQLALKQDIQSMVPPKVLVYIQKNGLYLGCKA